MSRQSRRQQDKHRRQSRRLQGLSPQRPQQKKSPKKRKKSNKFVWRFTINDEQQTETNTKNFPKSISIDLKDGPDKAKGSYCVTASYFGSKHNKLFYDEPILSITGQHLCGLPKILQLNSHKWKNDYWIWYSGECHYLNDIHVQGEIISVDDSLIKITWNAIEKQKYILLGHEEECCLFGGKEIQINSNKEIEFMNDKMLYFHGRNMFHQVADNELNAKDQIIEILYYMNQQKNEKSIQNVMKVCTKLVKNEKWGIKGKIYERLGGAAWKETLLPKLNESNVEIEKNKAGRLLFDVTVTIDDDDNIIFHPPFFKPFFCVTISSSVTRFAAEIEMDYNPKNGKIRIEFPMLERNGDEPVDGQDILSKSLYE